MWFVSVGVTAFSLLIVICVWGDVGIRIKESTSSVLKILARFIGGFRDGKSPSELELSARTNGVVLSAAPSFVVWGEEFDGISFIPTTESVLPNVS